jgi:hypothetical protein
MSDETKKPEQNTGGWEMPEPVFRSSEGHTPKSPALGPQDDIPTEPGFSDDTTETSIELPVETDETTVDDQHQGVRASTKTRIRHHKKRSGCAKAFGFFAGAIALAVFAILIILVYFLFFYSPAETSF